MKKIIAVGHHKNVGKDTFIRYCIDVLRPKVKSVTIARRGFADKLYDFCYSVYSWAGFQRREYYINNPKAKEEILPILGKSPRELLIEIGNHMRKYDPPIWINAALSTTDVDILFISDLRYPNELEYCKKHGAITLKITRDCLPEPTDEADTALNTYEFDETFNNSGSQNDLYAFAVYFCNTRILTNESR